MRSLLLFGVAVSLLVTATATANTYTLTGRVSGSAQGTGTDTYVPAPGETFVVDIHITMSETLKAWQGDVALAGGASGYTTNVGVPAGAAGGHMSNYGYFSYVSYLWENDAGWDVPNSVSPDHATINPTYPALPNTVGTIALDGNVGASSGWAASFEITAPGTPGDIPGQLTLENPYGQKMDSDPADVTVVPLNLPEPASALLLLLGLPFLRRR